MISIEDSLKTITREQFVSLLLDMMRGANFQTDSWEDGSIQKTFNSLFATLAADLTELTSSAVAFTWNKHATGVPLKQLSLNTFDNAYSPAQKTVGPMTLTNAASVPYGIKPGQLLSLSNNGIYFQNINGSEQTLPAGGQLIVNWEAKKAGASGNVPNDSVKTLTTPLAGVSINNPSVSGPWYTTIGTDEQSAASLREQNRTKWGTFSIDMVRDGYEYFARTVTGITKVYVDDANPRGYGTVDVYVAGDTALVGTDEKTALQLIYANRISGATADYPPISSSDVHVLDGSTATLTVAGTIYYTATLAEADVQARVDAALTALIAVTPMGGNTYSDSVANILALDDIVETLRDTVGVEKVDITTPSANVALTIDQLFTAIDTTGITYLPKAVS